jgi:glycosyltransferase involved in cell wall biosynthesis
MKILLVHQGLSVPVHSYGGTERVIWDLAKGLVALGYEVTFLVPEGSVCDFAQVIGIDPARDILSQIPRQAFDIVHAQFKFDEEPDFPYLVTEHGNTKSPAPLNLNTVFISKNHADRYGSGAFVYNGLDWSSYGPVDWSMPRRHHHFLGKGSWPVKNLKGAIQVARQAGVELAVMGGTRLNLSRTFRFTPWRSIHFHGMVGGALKFRLLNESRGMIFPVRWHEPFGLAVIESLYFGNPVFSTPYGALPELVQAQHGFLSYSAAELAQAVQGMRFDPQACHQWAVSQFNHLAMARGYLDKYQRVLDGERMNASPPILQENGHRLLPWNA